MVVAAVTAIFVAVSTGRAERWTAHSLEVRQAQAILFSLVQDAETGQRGYLLTGDIAYLRPFERAERRLSELEASLARLVADDPAQKARLAGLAGDIEKKMDELRRTVALRKAGDATGALAIVRSNEGRDLMLRIRAQSAAFDEAEARTLADRQASAARLRTVLIGLIVVALLIVALLGYLVATAARRHAGEILDQNKALLQEKENREQAEAMLRQAQKMEALGQLTGGVAHDFNNMLAIIVGNMDMMLRRLSEDETRLRSLAEAALTGANRAAALTRRLLAFSRLQPLDPKSVDVNKCVSGMSEMLRRSLGEHIAVETVLSGGLWRAFVDAPQLESAILNLAVNARDAMGERGRLTIETSNASLDASYAEQHVEVDPGQYVLIALTDTGSGMSPEVMSKAFEPFFTTKKVGEGTGLGLSQVHGFLKQSRGHIKIYSEVGVGTTVKLYLPRDTSAGAHGVEPARQSQKIVDRAAHTVLIVEDDPGVRSFVVSAARELGFGVIEADNAVVALERLEAHPQISILLTDVVMPGVTGRQLVDMALARRADLQVIYMTGYTRNAIVHNGMLDPGTHLLVKPFTLEELDRELLAIIAQ
nr:CHASE3 domain-containing protein [Sphingomonas sp. dw_22]